MSITENHGIILSLFLNDYAMYSMKTSDSFVKSGDFIFPKDEIALLDCSRLEELIVTLTLKTGQVIVAEDIHALELVMQVKPSMFEGKRLKWAKFVWFIHNIFGHPLTQIFSLFKCYRLAFWIHDVTVPKPLGKKSKKK